MNNAQLLFVVFIALAFLTDSTSINESQSEAFQSIDTVNAQITSANLKLTSNFYHYLMWLIACATLLGLTVHFSQQETTGPMNIIVMLIILIVLLYFTRYLWRHYSFRIVTGS